MSAMPDSPFTAVRRDIFGLALGRSYSLPVGQATAEMNLPKECKAECLTGWTREGK